MFEDHFFPEDEDTIPMTYSMYIFLQLLDYSYYESYRDYIYPMNHTFEESDDFGAVQKKRDLYKENIRYSDFIETFKLIFNV